MGKGRKKTIVAKYGARYGSTLRKRVMEFELKAKAKYECQKCGRLTVRRRSVGLWECRKCGNTFAGGAFVPFLRAGV